MFSVYSWLKLAGGDYLLYAPRSLLLAATKPPRTDVFLNTPPLILRSLPELFQRAIDELGVYTTRILFVGDDLRIDIDGAKGANLATAWINPSDRDLPTDSKVPDLVIRDLGELLMR
jgi:phosphoglycolate phosphatase-like HAD superfamily hydrolase